MFTLLDQPESEPFLPGLPWSLLRQHDAATSVLLCGHILPLGSLVSSFSDLVLCSRSRWTSMSWYAVGVVYSAFLSWTL